MLYNFAILGLSLIGIIPCEGRWIRTEKTQQTTNSNRLNWNIDPASNLDSPKANDFEFENTFEILGAIPPDFSKLAPYLGETIILDRIGTSPKRYVIDKRLLVPVQEQAEDVKQPGFQRVDTRRPPLIPKDVKYNTRPTTNRKDYSWQPTFRKDNTKINGYRRPIFDYERKHRFQVERS